MERQEPSKERGCAPARRCDAKAQGRERARRTVRLEHLLIPPPLHALATRKSFTALYPPRARTMPAPKTFDFEAAVKELPKDMRDWLDAGGLDTAAWVADSVLPEFVKCPNDVMVEVPVGQDFMNLICAETSINKGATRFAQVLNVYRACHVNAPAPGAEPRAPPTVPLTLADPATEECYELGPL